MSAGRPAGFPDLGPLLSPRSIVVVGASPRQGNVGGAAVRLLRQHGFPGSVATVHPRGDAVGDVPCYRSIDRLPAPADLALLAVPGPVTPQVVRDCAAVGTTHGIVWSGGFAETSDGEGLQEELEDACLETGFRLLGPNSLGIIAPHVPMTATFASFLWELEELAAGGIAMVSQSGGLATVAQALALRMGFGFHSMVSTGNEAVLTVADFVHHLAGQDDVDVIACYLEGVEDGDRFVAALGAARRAGKPVVVLKAGATEASARAATAHTGAMVGAAEVWDAVLDEFGVIRVDSLEGLLDVVLLLSSLEPDRSPRGAGLAAVTFGGGMGVLAADQAVANGLTTPLLSDESRAALDVLIPPVASVDNPVDLTPQTYLDASWLDLLPQALDVIAGDDGIDTILVMAGPMAIGGETVAEVLVDFRNRCPKPVLVVWPLPPTGVPERLSRAGLHVLEESERVIRAVGAIVAASRRAAHDQRGTRGTVTVAWDLHVPSPRPGIVVPEDRCHALMAEAGLAVAAGHVTDTEDAAVAAARSFDGPVVLKAITETVTHRAAAGLVALGLTGEAEVRAAFRSMEERARRSGVALDGVLVQEMVDGEHEVLVSVFRDPVFGLMVGCGSGGALTEQIRDVVLRRGPLDRAGARALLGRVGTLRTVMDDVENPGTAGLLEFVTRLSWLGASAPWRQFLLEVNPVRVSDRAAVAADGLLIVEDPAPAGGD